MNRLKFRAWNGETMNYNIMVGKFGAFWVNAGKYNDRLDENDKASLTPFNTKCSETTEVMQFIGITDKNGKEVYNGDVIKTKGATGYVYYENNHCMYMVRFPLNRSCWSFDSLDDELEIIGNIYENTELISDKL